jgi:pyruvate/2-oxoglutarate/acetoin dehydrogenase E1 component
MPEITYLEALREAFRRDGADDSVFCMGEDIGAYGGAFKVTDGLLDRFGESRVIDTPISEIAIVGAAAGAGTWACGQSSRCSSSTSSRTRTTC